RKDVFDVEFSNKPEDLVLADAPDRAVRVPPARCAREGLEVFALSPTQKVSGFLDPLPDIAEATDARDLLAQVFLPDQEIFDLAAAPGRPGGIELPGGLTLLREQRVLLAPEEAVGLLQLGHSRIQAVAQALPKLDGRYSVCSTSRDASAE